MLIGFFRPALLLPSAEITSDGLVLILRHELIHLKRHDLWYKALVLLATVIHWFNPVVYIMAKAIAAQCEISCDEQVLQGQVSNNAGNTVKPLSESSKTELSSKQRYQRIFMEGKKV
jgi:beta-lactamase regulating signal transducer with metallopeptidase domain